MADTSSSTAPPSPPPLSKRLRRQGSSHPVHKTLATAANLANLLPTGTVLGFRALTPSFTNRGTTCLSSNHLLTSTLIGVSAIICFLTCFTDTIIDPSHGKLYYGIATFRGFYVFNYGTRHRSYDHEGAAVTVAISGGDDHDELKRFKISGIDIVHAFLSLIVFLVFAISDTDVQSCLFPKSGANLNVLLMNLPLGVGVLASFLFTVFPTTRTGLGCMDFALHTKAVALQPT